MLPLSCCVILRTRREHLQRRRKLSYACVVKQCVFCETFYAGGTPKSSNQVGPRGGVCQGDDKISPLEIRRRLSLPISFSFAFRLPKSKTFIGQYRRGASASLATWGRLKAISRSSKRTHIVSLVHQSEATITYVIWQPHLVKKFPSFT